MQITPSKLKQHLAGKSLLSTSSNRDRQQLADEIARWFTDHAKDLPPLKQIDLLRGFIYDQGIVFEHWTDADKLRWLIALIGRLVRCDPLADRDWSPPVQFRVKSLFDGIDRLGDYVLLYEAFIHFHFVVVASQFVWMTRHRDPAGLPPTVALGQKIMHVALTDRKCMGGRVWLHRAGGISRAAHDLLKQAAGSLDAPLAELFDLLEPQTLDLHPGFGNGPGQDQIVRTGGLTFRLFALLQQVRNTLMAHADDIGGEVEESVAAGLLTLFGAMGQQLAPYQRLGLAVTGYAEQQLVLKALWDADGNLRQPQNNAVRRSYFIPLWGAPPEPQAPFLAPVPPTVEGWSWEDSLVLFDRAAPRTRYLYLMPLGYRYAHEDGADKLLPGLLDSVIWRKIAGTQRTSLTLIQRKYLDRAELANDWHDAQDQQTPRTCPAHENVQALVESIAKTYNLDFALPEEETAAVTRVFDLRHGQQALRLAQATVPRLGEVDRIFTKARDLVVHNTAGCVLLLVIGPSGIGKSVLMAQMYARVSDRALFFTMDNAPEPEYEVIPATRKVTLSVGALGDGRLSLNELQAPSLNGDRRERSLGVPVRMHWLAGARELRHKPAPIFLLDTEETQRQIAALLQEAAAGPDPLYIFIDAVNQTPVPESLLQGFKPFSRLPANVVIIASTQDNETVLARLTDNGRQPWEKVFVEALAQEQTRAVFLQDLQADPPPALSDGFIRFVHEQSRGLPLLVRYWGERFAALWQTNAATAERTMQAELGRSGAKLLPRAYFDRLKEASRDFVPTKLPEALLWCFSLVAKPLGAEPLTQAVARIRVHVEGLPAVSKADIDAAITRLSGYLQAELAGFERLWRLAHPVIGEAWLDYFGTRERIAAINKALLPFGAMPRIEVWDTDKFYSDIHIRRCINLDNKLINLDVVELKRALLKLLVSHHHQQRAEELIKQNKLAEAITAYDAAIIALRDALRAELEPAGRRTEKMRNDLANAYMNRGNAKQQASGHGPGAALADYDRAIALMEALRAELEPAGRWEVSLRNDLAGAYTNRGTAKQQASGHGPGAALADYDRAIALRQALSAELEPAGRWEVGLRNDLAGAYSNRGNAKQQASGHGPGAALADYDAAIELREALRAELEPAGRWEVGLRNELADAYMNRGNARQQASGHGPGAALADYDRAIALMEALRAELEPAGRWEVGLRNDLAMAYMNRGIARKQAGDLVEAIEDWGTAAMIYRQRVEQGWLPAGTDLLKATFWVFGGYRDLADWPSAADYLLAFEAFRQRLEAQWAEQHADLEPPWRDIVGKFANTVHALNPDQRAALLEALGENAEGVKEAFGWG